METAKIIGWMALGAVVFALVYALAVTNVDSSTAPFNDPDIPRSSLVKNGVVAVMICGKKADAELLRVAKAVGGKRHVVFGAKARRLPRLL
jgi:hypothetical protein